VPRCSPAWKPNCRPSSLHSSGARRSSRSSSLWRPL
jgi:hypothetical protein